MIYLTHPELDNSIKQIKSIGKNRVKIIFKDGQSANSLASSKNLHAYNLEAPIPKFLLVRQGVISNIDTYLSEDTIKNKINLIITQTLK